MSAVAQKIPASENQGNPFSSIKAVNRSTLSKGAKVLYSQLRISAGNRGRIQYRIVKLAADTDSSETSVKSYANELKNEGLLIPYHRVGRSNVWYVFDPPPNWPGGPSAASADETQTEERPYPGGGQTPPQAAGRPHENVLGKTFVQNVKNVPPPPSAYPEPPGAVSGNVDKICVPKEKPAERAPQEAWNHIPSRSRVFDTTLLQEIIDLTGDRKSMGCWIACLNQLPEEEIRIAMSSLRLAMTESNIYKPGAYLLRVLRARNP